MTETKPTLSPIKKVKAVLALTPKSPRSPKSPIRVMTETIETNEMADTAKSPKHAVTEVGTRMEETYFDSPQSRQSLSVNPGDQLYHQAERKRCTTENWRAEIERRILAKSMMVDHAYGEEHPLREQAYGHGDGQK
ncbi:hypothetical protein H2200_006881 [Cladophialophora chaetospira]|uniref:Uncharacterized protein n=1 Tax=Cladophialophora chaetospira TaxID=386627 RepID=A0AA38X981_9EURO|nr:hypothetical protein H2200_006881 [Cladophialophora chaetospira]